MFISLFPNQQPINRYPWLTKDYLDSLFILNEETGDLYWKRDFQNGIRSGDLAGTDEPGPRLGERGYRVIGLNHRTIRAHIIVWLMTRGFYPPYALDHIDQDRGNNRPDNLRLATPRQNAANSRLSSRNKTGHRGVSYDKQNRRYRADCCHVCLGYFHTATEAAAAYRTAAKEVFGDFARFA